MADGFIFYRSFAEAFDDLDAVTYKEVVQAIARYALDGEEPDGLTGMAKMAFLLVRPQIDANNARRTAGAKGGRPVKEENHRLSEPETIGFETDNHRLPDEKPKEKEKVNVKDKEKDKENKDSSSEPSPKASEPVADVEAIPLNDGSEWRPSQKQFEEYERLYPAVNVRDEFRTMRGWCQGNPTRRKTKTGVTRFVANWLAKEQNRGTQPRGPAPVKKNGFNSFEQRDYGYTALERALIGGGA